MTIKKITHLILLPSFILSLFLGAIISDEENTPVALVKKIVRDVTKKVSSENEWELAKSGEPLYDGEEVKTGNKSLALIYFTDGSGLLRVRENSIANIYGKRQDKSVDKNTVLQSGTIGFEVNKQSEDEEFKFTTPTMVASIRGTSGLIEVGEVVMESDDKNVQEPEILTTLIVEEGSIEVQSTAGDKSTETVKAGQSLISNKSGELLIGVITDDQKKALERSKATKMKKIRFMKDGVRYELEYYEKED